jgi:mannitol operon transcriptional antiterminator
LNKGEINPRTKNIILILCKQKNFMTISDIAAELQVSPKTIIRELPKINSLLSEYTVQLDKKQGVGIRITGSTETIDNIKDTFSTVPEKVVYQPKERAGFLTARLLQNQQPMKLFELALHLNVAESTISSDLDKLENWFTSHRLTLIRKPGLGVYVSGSEKDIRKAILHYIYENIDETDLIEILHNTLAKDSNEKDLVNSSSQRLLNLVDTQILRKLETVIHQMESQEAFKLSDNAYAGLLIHLALAIQRMNQKEKITFDDSFLKNITDKHEFVISRRIAKSIEQIFAIKVPVEEIGYIAMHLLGTRNQYYTGSTPFIPNFQLVQLAKKIIKIAQAETGKKLDNNEKLLIGLVNHLGPSISRLKMGMDIRNPLLEDIKENYASLMQLSQICCTVLQKVVDTRIPESEIAYIAMHLGAALENIQSDSNIKYHAAIACPTGLGSSKLLASRIKHEFNNIQIMDIISALRFDTQELNKRQIDFILSTVPITNAPVPVLVINALLKQEDIQLINTFLAKLKYTAKRNIGSCSRQFSLTEIINHMMHYQQAILNILNTFVFLDDFTSINTAHIINRISFAIKDSKATPQTIMQALFEREKYGSTYLHEQKIILLHCRTNVSYPHFAIVKIKPELIKNSDQFVASIIMIIPDDDKKENAETMGAITEALVENWLFASVITNNSKPEIKLALENILKNFLQKKINSLLK